MYKIDLVLGDVGGDGHDKTYRTVIDTNLSKTEIEKAYELGAKKIGVDLIEKIATDYGESVISVKDFNKFKKAGLDLGCPLEESTDESCLCLDMVSYTELFLFTIKVGNSKFTFTVIEPDEIDIGGYGLLE